MPFGDLKHLIDLWKWAFAEHKQYRIPLAVIGTMAGIAAFYLIFLTKTEDRLQILANWCSDTAYWAGVPVSWATAYWKVFVAVMLAILTVTSIITYIIVKVNQEMNRRVDETNSAASKTKDDAKECGKAKEKLQSDLSESRQEIESVKTATEERIRNIQHNMDYDIQRVKQDAELAQDYLTRASLTIREMADQHIGNCGKDPSDCVECVRKLNDQLSEYNKELRDRLIRDANIRKTASGGSPYQFRQAKLGYDFDGRVAPSIPSDAFESKNAEWLKKHEREK